MQRILVLLVLVSIFSVSAIGQGKTEAELYSATYEKGAGTAIFPNVTLDSAWPAAMKVLMTGKNNKITSSEKQSGMIVAQHVPFASTNYTLTLYFEQDGTGVKVLSTIGPIQRQEGIGGLLQNTGWNKAAHKEEKKFYDKLAAELYK